MISNYIGGSVMALLVLGLVVFFAINAANEDKRLVQNYLDAFEPNKQTVLQVRRLDAITWAVHVRPTGKPIGWRIATISPRGPWVVNIGPSQGYLPNERLDP